MYRKTRLRDWERTERLRDLPARRAPRSWVWKGSRERRPHSSDLGYHSPPPRPSQFSPPGRRSDPSQPPGRLTGPAQFLMFPCCPSSVMLSQHNTQLTTEWSNRLTLARTTSLSTVCPEQSSPYRNPTCCTRSVWNVELLIISTFYIQQSTVTTCKTQTIILVKIKYLSSTDYIDKSWLFVFPTSLTYYCVNYSPDEKSCTHNTCATVLLFC